MILLIDLYYKTNFRRLTERLMTDFPGRNYEWVLKPDASTTGFGSNDSIRRSKVDGFFSRSNLFISGAHLPPPKALYKTERV